MASENLTRQDLFDAESRIVSVLKAYVDERSAQVETRLEMKLEQVETRLLTEFHKWASASEARQRTHAAAIRAIDLEMEQLDDRLKKLEGRQ